MSAQVRTITRTARKFAARSHAVPILQVYALALLIIPSNIVVRAFGAGGYAAGLVGMFAFAALLATILLGFHDPLRHPHPVRGVLCLMWVVSLTSYVLMDRRTLSWAQAAAADRFLIQLAVVTGVALIAAEFLTSLDDVRRVLRAVCWGGAFCGAVATLQFWLSLDLAPYLRMLPGFSENLELSALGSRAALNRAAGTAISPIELGVAAAMLLPLAIYLGIHDTARKPWKRWTPVLFIALAIPTSVSRSAVLAVVAALLVLVIVLPARQRVVALCTLPLAVAAVFMTARGLIGTLTAFFTAGTSDASVATRVDDYPMVERLVHEKPWFGHGGGTYMHANLLEVLDNQYLKTAIELGLVGLAAFVAFLVLPFVAALAAMRRTTDTELRLLCGALAGSCVAATVGSLTFDSLSFPMYFGLHALVIGLVGTGCRLAAPNGFSAAAPVRARALAAHGPVVPHKTAWRVRG